MITIQEQLREKYEEQEEILRQKSRVIWIQKGDANSKFFHTAIKRKRWRNNILGIQYKGSWITNPSLVKNIFANHFEERFKRPSSPQCFQMVSMNIKRISIGASEALERIFSEVEIIDALKDIHPNKSPGSDCFNGFYIRNFWDFLKEDLINLIGRFYESNSLPPGINSSFIALIPKVLTPLMVQDFRPISLISCTMKIILKILSKRLKTVLPSLISQVQFAFVKDRNISECILIAGEICA